MEKKKKPPEIFVKILEGIIAVQDRESLPGDFEEKYNQLSRESGVKKALFWYLLQIINLMPVFTKNTVFWSLTMFFSYMKITLRNMKRQKIYALLNIFGLAVGMTVFIFIFIYVDYELSYDKYHENTDNIYRLVWKDPDPWYMGSNLRPSVSAPIGPALVEVFPEVAVAARVANSRNVLLSHSEEKFIEDYVYFADENIFEIFSFELISGNPKTALKDQFSLILSERMAEKYFGDNDPLGEIIRYEDSYDFKITGIMKDIPGNSHLAMDFIAPFNTITTISRFITKETLENWESGFCSTYCLLSGNTDLQEFQKKLPNFVDTYYYKKREIDNKSKRVLWFQPLTRIYLYPLNGKGGPLVNVFIFSTIAVFILIIACINYMNLATARSSQRVKEIGIRKVIGAQKRQLISQFYCESLLFSVFAFIFALVLIGIFLPQFNSFTGKSMILNILENYNILLMFFAIVIVVSIFAGSYPALYISAYKPLHVLKGIFRTNAKSTLFRNFLVIFQFSLSIILIISTFVVRDQLQYIKNTDVGYKKDRIVVLPVRDREVGNKSETIKTELRKNPDILNVSVSSHLPNNIWYASPANWPGKLETEKEIMFYYGMFDIDFIDVYNIEITKGEVLYRNFGSGNEGFILLNETGVKALGWEDPLNREFIFYRNERRARITGVLNDFNFHSLHRRIDPLFLYIGTTGLSEHLRHISVKIKGEGIPEILGFLEKQMKKFSPNYPFEYRFFDEIFNEVYKSEQKMSNIFRLFSFITIFIACLGLFGLASFAAEKRTKEIGIRKVLGASVSGIIMLLSREFTKWVIVSNVIAWPIAFYTMNKWLQNFAYRTNLGIYIFILSGFIALVIAILTVSYQAFRSATVNPVDALKYE